MSDSLETKIVSSWRIQLGNPEGLTMWFDPSIEAPMLGILPPEQRDDAAGSAYFQYDLELRRDGRGSTCEGGDASISAEGSECPGEPPQDFLDSLWEGYDGETHER